MAKRSRIKFPRRKRKQPGIMHNRSAPGSRPGTLVANPDSPAPQYSILRFDPQRYEEFSPATLDEVLELQAGYAVTWINVEGLGDIEAVKRIGQAFGLHPLALEDVVNAHQRPKLESYKNVLFLTARMPHPELENVTEQVSFFLGENFVVTFQEGTPGDCFEPVRQRIREHTGKIRLHAAGYLLYALLDALVDQFFPLLDQYAERLEDIEDQIIAHPLVAVTNELYQIRRQLFVLQRMVRPLKDVIQSLMREFQVRYDEELHWYLRDTEDHIAQLMDLLESYRNLSTQLMDMSASASSMRLNEIMRFLTVMSSIFIPLTFLSSIYGMNFNPQVSPWNMPELNWAYGYPGLMGLMVVITLVMLWWFRYKGWLGIPESEKSS